MDAARFGIDKLDRQRQLLASRGRNTVYQQFLMAPTNPPSTSIHISGGKTGSAWSGSILPSTTFDLADYDTLQRSPVFVNAGWYGFYWLAINGFDASRLYVGGTTATAWFVEYETAVEAEQAAMAPDCPQIVTFSPFDYGPVLGIVILRNNGNTAQGNQFLPIDAVNRGRSYIYRTHDSFIPSNMT